MKKSKAVVLSLICTPIITVMILFMTVFGYAYFKVSSENNFNSNVNVDLLFHRYETEVLEEYQAALVAEKTAAAGQTVTNPWTNANDAPWGTEYNPFVITNPYHLQNLSRLTASGYFENFFYKDYKVGDTTLITAKENIPYFVVSDRNGDITVLDASDYYISPIGSASRPFIGSFRGALLDGVASVQIKKSDSEVYTSATSAIYNLDIETHYDVVDIGLFGYVGYTLDSIEEVQTTVNEQTVTAIKVNPAKVSTLKDILIVDQRITSNLSAVDLTTWFSGTVEFYESITADEGLGLLTSINKHYFNYPGTYDSNGVLSGGRDFDGTYVHKDTHHIGILAGHIEYTTVENISVFYTANNICAIDIQGKGGNANYYSRTGIFGTVRNMNAKISYDGEGSYIVDEEGLSDKNISSGGGLGTGGGLLSGTGQGYVTATEIYQMFNFTKGTAAYATSSGALYTTNKYRDQYGILDLWAYQIDDEHGPFVAIPVYAYPDGNGAYNYYLEETKNTSATVDLDAGKVTASVVIGYDEGGNEIKETKEWTDFIIGYADKATATTNSPYEYTFYGKASAAGEFEEVKYCNELSMYIMDGVTESGESLCTKYESDALIDFTGELYYFYDGVFTFVLSSKEDTMEDTWKNGNVDKLVLGSTNAADWEVNYSHGNHSVAAFLKPITNKVDYNKAVSDGKPFYILVKTGVTDSEHPEREQVFIMSINLGSSDTSEREWQDNRYTSPGITLNFDTKLSEDLLQSFMGGDLTDENLPKTPGNQNMESSIEDLIEHWSSYTILNIGATANGLTVEKLKQQYNIVSGFNSVTYYYTSDSDANLANGFTEGGTAQTINNYQAYDTYVWNGYFYYNTSYNGRYRYYYVPANGGNRVEIATNQTMTPDQFFTKVANDDPYGGIPTYTCTYGGTTYGGETGLIVLSNRSNSSNSGTISAYNGTSSGVSVTYSNSVVTKVGTTPINFIFVDSDGTNQRYYYFTTNGELVELNLPTRTNTQTSAGTYFYSATPKNGGAAVQGILLSRKTSGYTYSDTATGSDKKYLNLIESEDDFLGFIPVPYESFWSGTDNDRNNLNCSDYQKQAGITFDSSGFCRIVYTLGGTNYYLNYSGSAFNMSESTSASTRLYIYTVEGYSTLDYGRVTFDPKESTTHHELAADAYVLWPETVYSGSVANKTSGTQSFTIKSVAELADKNWVSRFGGKLTSSVLHKKFQMTEATDFALHFGLGSFIGMGNAPVVPLGGPEPAYATVPQGCVGFKVNEVKTGGSNIRVIVAVPTSEIAPTEGGYALGYGTDYYFGLWEMNEEGSNTNSFFGIEYAYDYIDKNEPITAFELPRSHPFDPADTPTSIGNRYGKEEYIDVTYNGNQYRAYLNGETVLVAYEFTVNDIGVYILGSTNSAMEIVYFAAEGTASEGSDGLASGQLGSVDFVYASNTNQIITVDMTQPDTDSTYNTNSYYYASGCMLSINNISKNAVSGGYFLRANDLQLYVYRRQNGNNRYIYALSTATTAVNSNHGAIDRYLIATGDNAMLPKTDGTWNYEATFEQLPERKVKN